MYPLVRVSSYFDESNVQYHGLEEEHPGIGKEKMASQRNHWDFQTLEAETKVDHWEQMS